MALLEFLLFALYRFFLLPLALVFLKLFKAFLGSKIKQSLNDRENKNFQSLASRPIWIHASSGEIEYAKSLIREIKNAYPQSLILVTYFSPSAKKILEKIKGIDLFMPIPWDHSREVKKFLDFYNPLVALFARTDVWPEYSFQLKQRQIPSCLFAATLADNSSRSKGLSKWINRFSLNNLTKIFAVSKEDLLNFKAMGLHANIEVGGDTRYDQVLYRLQNPNTYKQFLKPKIAEKIFVAGSTWPEDEEVLIDFIEFLCKQNIRSVIAPHEIDENHLRHICEVLDSKKLSYDFYSRSNEWKNQILILDSIGHLQEIYSWAHFAFVGGSFKAKVHSVMEPLCLAIPVLLGPFHSNNREALKFQNFLLEPGVFAVNVVRNSREMIELAPKILGLPIPAIKLQQQILKEQHSTDKILSWLVSVSN